MDGELAHLDGRAAELIARQLPVIPHAVPATSFPAGIVTTGPTDAAGALIGGAAVTGAALASMLGAAFVVVAGDDLERHEATKHSIATAM